MDSKKSRRKSASPAATIKSPALAIKRSDEAPVTLKGWLYKQGSEGLQLWKKRWFVLSEYCLFYYKGPNEEKVSGSILLPSYTISPLCKDDGVYRKYAFKAEHANMRTYYFAAETKDSMIQWMNSLSLASILQNETKLRPELLARELSNQGNLLPHLRHFTLQHQPQIILHQQNTHMQQNMQQQKNNGFHFSLSPHGPGISEGGITCHIEGETRQPLYANAPPKPKRLNTSRDYSPSPDNSPERPSHSNFSPNSETNHHRSEDPTQFRHRLPQERRTPEAYGRSKFDSNPKYPTKDYEEVYNNGYDYSGGDKASLRRCSEEVAQYSRDSYASSHDRRMSTGNNVSNRNFPQIDGQSGLGDAHSHPQYPTSDNFPPHHGLPLQNGHQGQVQDRQRVPRPHSADFLEYERTHPETRHRDTDVKKHPKKPQPQRPKSCIGEKVKPDDFWSEEVYAQKMRESAFVYEQSSSRSQSRASQPVRPPMSKSSTMPVLFPSDPSKTPNNFYGFSSDSSSVPDQQNFHPLQLSPARNSLHSEPGPHSPNFPPQLPPPAFYQDKSPRDPQLHSGHQHNKSPRSPMQSQGGQFYSPNQSFASSNSTPHHSTPHQPIPYYHQNNSYQEDQEVANSNARALQMTPVSHRMTPSMYKQEQNYVHHQSEMYNMQDKFTSANQQNEFYKHQMMQNQISQNHNELPQNQDQNLMQPNNQQMRRTPMHLSPNQSQPMHNQMLQNQHHIMQNQLNNFQQFTENHQQYTLSRNEFSGMKQEHIQTFGRNDAQANLKYQALSPDQQVSAHMQRMNLHNQAMSPSHQYPPPQMNENLGYADNEPKITMPPSFPQPLPRKQSTHTPTMYQNIPPNSKALSDPRPVSSCRLETATPNRLSEKFDSDRSNESQGDFRRSASARLPKHKTRATDYLNNTFNEESDDSKKNSEQVGREESMKRLLEWKQRMLQSPLTRKSSRNASRTQTPTNSDSPVPSINNDDIRKKVLEELQYTEPSTPTLQPSKEKRLSRKTSSGSRSSRSRSSPRIAPSKNQIYSSDEEEIGDPRQSRKRTKSQQSARSRNSSKESKRSQSTKSEQAKSRSQSASCTSPNLDQPEYINISTLKTGKETKERDLSWTSKIKPVNAIGPDDWYRDDFDFDKSHPFLDDPMLLKQYAQILDMKYRESSTEKIEEILKQGSLVDQTELELSMYEPKNSRNKERTKKVRDEDLNRLSPARHIGHEFSQGRYPDSGYDTLRMDLRGDRPQLCVDIDIEKEIVNMRNEPLGKEAGFKPSKDERKVHSWHSSQFADFQLMDKGEETVFLSIEGHGENLEKAIKRSPRDRDDDKVVWHVGKSYREIRKEKEAPPKNVVKERLKNFESGQEIPETQPSLSHNNALKSTTPTPFEDKNSRKEVNTWTDNTRRSDSRSGDKFKIIQDNTKNNQKDFDIVDPSSGSEEEFVSKKMEHKKSVKDLLSKFEQNSKALDEKEEGYRGIGSYLLRDTRDAGGRRGFSDTETLNYETSSDEEQCDGFSQPKTMFSLKQKEKEDNELPSQIPVTAPPPLPPKNPPQSPKTVPDSPSFSINYKPGNNSFQYPKLDKNETDEANTSAFSQSQEQRNQDILNEDTYLAMTPAKSLSSLPCTPTRKQSQPLLSSAHNSRTSLTSSHGSSQSITSQTLQRFESDKNLGSMTPTEALIHSSTASVNHSRTPSQTLVMEHFQTEGGHPRRLEEETYVDMNEDGSYSRTPRMRTKEPILAKQCNAKESLDTTLTYESPESPRYCEIEDTTEQSHYEYLCNARTANPQHYEVVYQEISDNENIGNPKGSKSSAPSKQPRKKEPEPLRPIEGLPDILGNAPTNKGNSSSDADDESSKDFDALEMSSQQIISLDDSFRPASFYLSHCKNSNNECDDDSSDSDLVSPPPVPSSPPPMEEVLGFTSPNDLDAPNPPDNLSNVLTAAKSAHAMRERSRRDSQEEATRRPSVGSRTSYGSQQSAPHGSQQSLNREMNMSPQRLHGSHQSLSSRELPPLPNQNLQGSQQSLASKEIQLIGSRGSLQSHENSIRNSPYHSREGSLDNEAFLFHKFTQGTSIGENARRPGSDSAEISSSDTANYEQEYRRYHLENIQEVSNTLERTESGSHNTSIISQDLNISYNSVYDSRLQQSKVYKIEEHPVLNKRKSLDDRQTQKYFQPDPHSKEIEDEMTMNRAGEVSMSRPKVPYYVSDIMEDGTVVSSNNDQSKISLKFGEFNDHGDTGSLEMVDVITKSMNALDVESNSYFEDKNQVENERIKMLRRSYTPDPYLTKQSQKDPTRSPVNEGHFESNNVSRSKSLEGLLGDSQGGPKDNIAYATQPKVYSPHNFSDIPPSSNPKPARGHQPPPPPAGVPPLDIRPLASPAHMMRHQPNVTKEEKDAQDTSVDDEMWAENLRRASMRQRAKSIDNLEENRPKQNIPPPTAPKPKTPVHMMHKEQRPIPSYVQPPVASSTHGFYNGEPIPGRSPVKRNSQIQNQSNEFQFSAHQRPGLASPRHDRSQESYMQESAQQNFYMNSRPAAQEMNRQTPVPQRNSVNRQSNFLEAGLPNPTSDHNERRTVSRPTSRGPVSPEWMGRQPLSKDTINSKSMTLPARIKYSQENSPRDMSSFDSDNSPRTRTSKSGLPEAGDPVPPSPSPVSGIPSPRASMIQAPMKPLMHQTPPQINQHSISPPKENAGHQRYKDASEDMTRIRRRNNSTSRKSADLETLKRKFGGNLANITAGDLLGKSQEELVLILIQLRRQSSSLSEAIDACKAELDNIRNMGDQPAGDLRQHTCELEEQLARVIPVINLVDNMVKLGTLYRGSDNTPLSQRMGTIKTIQAKGNQASNNNKLNEIQGNLDHSLHALRTQDDTMAEQESFNKQQKLLEKELARVQTQLRLSHKTLDESVADMSRLEQDMNVLSLEHHNSVQRDMHRGGHSSQNTLSIENNMKEVQQAGIDLQRRRHDMMQQIQRLTQKESLLTNEIRPSPTGVAGAEPIPQKKKHQDTWYETDIDNNFTKDWGPETEEQIKKESRVATKTQDDIPMYVNTYEEEKHNYENYENYEQFKAQVAKNPYEDDVQTIHSEGVRSEMEGPPLPARPHKHNNSDDEVIIGLGDIGEADERVQRFYGIIPKEKPSEIKTVRMVKRDNKERSSKVRKGNGDEDSESIDLSVDEEEQPPPPLPRGNYQNLHNFLSNQPYETYTTESSNITQNSNYHDTPVRGDFSTRSLPRNYNKAETENVTNNNYLQKSQPQRPNFKLGEYNRRPSENNSRPGSALSAHERLFGTSRDESMSPDMSPVKSNSINSSDSGQSAMMSPIFKSAAARAIIEEERKTPVIIPKAKKKSKKRHMTITSSHPAVLEALNRHDAKMDRSRSRDDMDMERILKPRDAPDVVRSTYGQTDPEFRTNALDNLFGAPEKINIPERYIPEQTDEKSPEEKRTRLKKADSIRRMLADSSATPVVTRRGDKERPTNISEDKRQREQILALNQVLARQVMEKSRAVAGQSKE